MFLAGTTAVSFHTQVARLRELTALPESWTQTDGTSGGAMIFETDERCGGAHVA